MKAKVLTVEVTEKELSIIQAGLELLRLKLREEDTKETGLYDLCKKLWSTRPPSIEVLKSVAANPEEP